MKLAYMITEEYHGKDGAEKAQADFINVVSNKGIPDDIENVKIDRRWPKYPDCKFVATIDGKWDLYELLINNNIMDNYCEGCIDLMKLEIYNEDDQKLFEDMFTYKIAFL